MLFGFFLGLLLLILLRLVLSIQSLPPFLVSLLYYLQCKLLSLLFHLPSLLDDLIHDLCLMKFYDSFSLSFITLFVFNIRRKATSCINVNAFSLFSIFIFLLLLLHGIQRFVPNNTAFLVPTHQQVALVLRHCIKSLLNDGCHNGSILTHHNTSRIINPVKDDDSIILVHNPSIV